MDKPGTRAQPAVNAPATGTDGARDEWVERTRLLLDLDMTSAPVVMVSAAGGAGKSTLARQWLRDSPRRTAMLRLAPHHDDPASLAWALLDVLDVQPDVAERAQGSVTSLEPTFSATLVPLIRELAAFPRGPYAIVIDDLQVISHPGCIELIATVCEGVPAGSQVMLLSRTTTPSWLARQRAEGRLAEFGPAALAFDDDEAARLFDGRGLAIPADQRARILEHTEGWAVGLYLSALAIRDGHVAGTGEPEYVPVGADRFIADYLSSQILDRTDPVTREFLLRTSILEELTGPLCDEVLGREDSSAVLARLHAANQLIVALDDVGERYRYHHLLSEALRTELTRRERPRVPELHVRAARWFVESGNPGAAIRHAKAAGDLPFVGDLAMASIGECIGTGRPDLLRQRLSGLSDRQIGSDPWLALAATWLGLMTGDLDAMNRWLVVAEGLVGADWRDRARTDPHAATLAITYALVAPGSLAEMAELASSAMLGLPRESGFRAPAAFLRGVSLSLGRDSSGARACLGQALSLARALGIPISEADSLAWLGVVAIMEGNRDEGSRLVMQAAAIGRRDHLDRLSTGAHILTAEAFVLALNHDRAPAEQTLAAARRLTVMIGPIAPWFAVCGRILQARTAILLGDGATARVLLAEARTLMTPDLESSLAQEMLEETALTLRSLAVDGVSADALTTAELRVLQFLPSHLTLRQIGEHLFLSQNTVKTHALSIYRKLGVSSRGESVARARSLGLVDASPRD